MSILGQVIGGVTADAVNRTLGSASSAGGTHRFPLERQNDYKGIIVFRPIPYTPPEVNTGIVRDQFKKVYDYGVDQLKKSSSFLYDPFSIGRQDGPEKLTPPSLETPVTQQTVRPAIRGVPDTDNGVILYLPQSIQYNDIIAYEQLGLGAIGAIGLAGIQSGAGAGSALYRGANQAVTSTIDLLTGKNMDQRAARLAATRLAENIPIGEGAQGAVKAGLGTTMNPNMINLFKSVSLREFSFTFKLIASSYQESIAIEKIIKFFRTTAYPDTINFDPDGLDVPIGYEFPNKFQITMKYNNNDVGLKILPSVLRSVQVTYNPGSMGWHREGHASEVDLTLMFGEERTLTKKDINQGY
jgi:hypothetical protein